MKLSDETEQTELAEKKRRARREMRKTIFEFTADKNRAEAASEKIAGIVLGSELYAVSGSIFIFASEAREVETRGLIASALKDGKRVALPRCTNAKGAMEFYYLDAALPFDEQTETGTFGITEPKTFLEKIDTSCFPHSSLFLMPALAFSRDGKRLGKGKGFYDRYAARIVHASPVFAGLCFSCQIIYDVPAGALDVSVSHIVCEDGIVTCAPPYIANR